MSNVEFPGDASFLGKGETQKAQTCRSQGDLGSPELTVLHTLQGPFKTLSAAQHHLLSRFIKIWAIHKNERY